MVGGVNGTDEQYSVGRRGLGVMNSSGNERYRDGGDLGGGGGGGGSGERRR